MSTIEKQDATLQLGEIPPWLVCPVCSTRPIIGTGMIEIDVYYFYWFGQTVNPLSKIQSGISLKSVAAWLGMARAALRSADGSTKDIFPGTMENAEELAQLIDSMIPKTPDVAFPDRLITEWEAARFKSLTTAMASTLKSESKKKYILAVQDQRGFSAYNLVERIENFFSAECWSLIGKDAKREFEESGKCLSVERYTGSGFHSLRGVECVIRQVILRLTGSLPKKRDWGAYVDALEKGGADAKITSVIDNIRSLERNPLMHPEDWLNIDDAVQILNISQTAVSRLASLLK